MSHCAIQTASRATAQRPAALFNTQLRHTCRSRAKDGGAEEV